MLTRVKSAVANFMGGVMAGGSNGADHPGGPELPLRFPYSRPEFLGLSPDEVECSADHIARPILILKETKRHNHRFTTAEDNQTVYCAI